MTTTAKELYKRIDPFVVERIRSIVTATSASSTSGTGTDSAAVATIRDAAILTVGNTSALNAERALVASGALSFTDSGANSNYTLTMATPGTLAVDSANDSSTNHTHAITASSSPGASSALLKSASDGGLTLTLLEATTSVTTPIVYATTNVTTPLITTASGDITIDPASRILEVDGTIVSRTSTTANVGAILQNTTDVDNSYSRIAIGYNAHWDFDSNLWTFGAAGANDSATLLVRNSSAALDLIFHASASSSTRTMDHSTFYAGAKFTFTNDGKFGVLDTSPSYEIDVTGTINATTSVLTPTLSTASGNLTISPAGDTVFDPTGNDVYPYSNYDLNLGLINKKWLTLHAAELWVETLVAQETIATIGGRILVGPTTTLTSDLASGATTIYVKHNQMSSGDRAYLEANGKVEFIAITSSYSGTGPYSYTVTRNLDGSGANDWYAGDAVFNTGQTNNGFIDIYSLYGIPRNGQTATNRAGPTIVGNVRLSSTYNDFRERWAVGSLNGLYDYSTEVYGFAAGNPTATWVGLDATNGLRMMSNTTKRMEITAAGTLNINNSSGTSVITLDNSGDSYFAGVMTLGTSGEVRQGTGTLGTDYTGLRIWRDSSVGRIGGYSSNTLQWYANTDGKLYAGGGSIMMDSAAVHFGNSGGTDGGLRFYRESTFTNTYKAGGLWVLSDLGNRVDIYAGRNISAYGDAANASGELYLIGYGSSGGSVSMIMSGSGNYISVSGTMRTDTLRPTTTDTYDLGTSSYYYNDAYIRTVNTDALSVSGSITVTGTVDGVDIAAFKTAYDSHTHAGYLSTSGGTLTGTLTARDIVPATTDTYDIGTSGVYYDHIYVRNLHTDTIVGTPSYAHSHDADYVNVSGDTMTDTLVMQFDDFAMITLDRTANANVDNTWNIGVSYISSTANDYAFFGKSDALQVFSDSSVKINNNTVWHAGNDGAGSGLDADTLDGVSGSGYALSGHNHTGVYVPVGRIVGSGFGLTGGGDLGSDVVISHEDTSTQASVNNANGTVIQDVTLDTYGHVTALGSVDLDSRYALIGDLADYVPVTRTVTAGAGLDGGGALSADITLSHEDTSSQANVTGSGTTFVYGMTFDTYGHVQTVTTSDIATALDSRYVNISGDTMTGNLTVNAQLAVSSATYPPATFERTGTTTNMILSAARVQATTTADMVDAFGTQILFAIKDSAGTANDVAGIRVKRNGSDTAGSLSLMTGGSSSENLIVLANGNTLIGQSSDSGYKLDVNGTARFVGTISAAANTDVDVTLGRAIVGYATGTDTATFAHYDNNTSTNYALTQSAAGATKVNSASGQSLDLAIANTSQFTVNTERLLPRSSVVMDIGDYNRKIRTIHATELAVTTLVAQEVISTIGGQVIVGETTRLIADISSSGTVGGTDALYTNMVGYWSLDETSGTRLDSLGVSHLTDKNTVANNTGVLGNAAQFLRANSERLTIADSATLSVSDIDFYMWGWVYATDDDGNTHCIVSKGGSSGDRAFALQLDWGDNRFEFTVWNSSDVSTVVNSSVTVSTNTWYFVEAWHNAASNIIGVAVNGTDTTTAHTTGVKNDTSQFTIGALGFTNYLTGRVDEVGFLKNYIPNSTRRTWLRNSGAGRTFTEIYNYGVGAFTMDVEHNFLQANDYVYMQAAPGGVAQFEVFQITSTYTAITGGYRYSATRDLDGTGANNWYIGDAVTSLGGSAGEGYINLTATTTLHNHYGPTIAHYVRTGSSSWDAVKPVVASGNLRSFVDYSTDTFGHAAGNDLLLAPDEGFKGYTCDTTDGMRMFNVDLLMYTDGVLTSRLDNQFGYRLHCADALTTDYVATTIKWQTDIEALTGEVGSITCYDLDPEGSQMRIAVRPSPSTTYASMSLSVLTDAGAAGIGIGEYSGATYISISAALTELNGGNLRVGGSGKHIEASEVWAYTSSGLALCDNAGGVALTVIDSTRYIEIATRLYTPTINALSGTTTFLSNISMSADIDMNSNDITEVGLLSMSGDIDCNGNDIIDIGQIGSTWSNLSFGSGWTNYGSYWGTGQYKRAGDIVMLRGMVYRSSGSGTVIGTLPVGSRPGTHEVYVVATNSGYGEVTISPSTGEITHRSGGTTYVSLADIQFSTLS